jgi:hypothetical protein
MSAAVAKPHLSIGVLPLLLALLAAYLLGGASGYVTNGLVAPRTTPVVLAKSACPAGTHAVVWYSAGTWDCEQNANAR